MFRWLRHAKVRTDQYACSRWPSLSAYFLMFTCIFVVSTNLGCIIFCSPALCCKLGGNKSRSKNDEMHDRCWVAKRTANTCTYIFSCFLISCCPMPQEATNTYRYHHVPTSDIQPDSMATMTPPLLEITRVRNHACTSAWTVSSIGFLLAEGSSQARGKK